jgi:hypothetical protein
LVTFPCIVTGGTGLNFPADAFSLLAGENP